MCNPYTVLLFQLLNENWKAHRKNVPELKNKVPGCTQTIANAALLLPSCYTQEPLQLQPFELTQDSKPRTMDRADNTRLEKFGKSNLQTEAYILLRCSHLEIFFALRDVDRCALHALQLPRGQVFREDGLARHDVVLDDLRQLFLQELKQLPPRQTNKQTKRVSRMRFASEIT